MPVPDGNDTPLSLRGPAVIATVCHPVRAAGCHPAAQTRDRFRLASVTSRGRGLRGLSRALERTVPLERALRSGAEQVRDEARETSERDGGSSARALSKSLEIERGDDSLSYRVVSRAPLGWFREFGALSRSQQPWLRAALDRARSGIVRRVAQAVRRIVSRRG